MAFIFGYSNLAVANNGTTPLQIVDMTADWIVVDDGSGNTLRVPMTTTVKIDKNQTQTSTEAFKRDEAGAANPTSWYSKWVYIWGIYNPATNTIAGLLSLSATAP